MIKKYYFKENKEQFKLALICNPKNYDIKGDFSNAENWKAKVLVANNGGKKGEIYKTRYVAISRNDNSIIPIAIHDEHHTGYDMLYDIYKVDSKDYLIIDSIGTTYIDSKDLNKYKPIIEKFLSWGGNKDNSMYFYDTREQYTFGDLVESNWDLSIVKDINKKSTEQNTIDFIKDWKNLAKKTENGKDEDVIKLFDMLKKLIIKWSNKMKKKNAYITPYTNPKFMEDLEKMIYNNQDINYFHDIVFGFCRKGTYPILDEDMKGWGSDYFSGVKNTWHKALKDTFSMTEDSIIKFFGSFDVVNMMGGI